MRHQVFSGKTGISESAALSTFASAGFLVGQQYFSHGIHNIDNAAVGILISGTWFFLLRQYKKYKETGKLPFNIT